MKKYVIGSLLALAIIISPSFILAQIPQNNLTPQARASLIAQLRVKLADLQQKLLVLIQQRQTPPVTVPNLATKWDHSLGEQNVGVILYYVKGREVAPSKTSQEIYSEILDDQNPYSLNSFFKEVSYGKMWLRGVVTPWLSISSQYPQADIQELVTAADPYIDYSKIKRLILINSRTDLDYAHGVGGGEPQTYQTSEGPQSFVVVILSFNPQKMG